MAKKKKTGTKAKKTTNSAAKKTAPKATKSAASAKKTGTAKTSKPATSSKKAGTAKTTKSVKSTKTGKGKNVKPVLKPDKNFEMGTADEKPIIIKKKPAKPKPESKVLRKAGKKGGYTVWDARTGKTFATEKEAKDYAIDVFKKTGIIIPITPTDRQVTHTFTSEEENKKKK